MSAEPGISVRLRCASWKQLELLRRRDLSRSALFLKSKKPPPIGTRLSVTLTLPSESSLQLTGVVTEHVPEGGMGGRGPGIDVKLDAMPQSAMWLIESALSSAQKAEGTVQKPQKAGESDIDEGVEVVAAERKLIDSLEQELTVLKGRNAFQVLDLAYDADESAIRRSFATLTKRYHPDRFARFDSEEVRKLAAEVFLVLRDAYNQISDEADRRKLLSQLEGGSGAAPPPTPKPPPTPPPTPAAAAEQTRVPKRPDTDTPDLVEDVLDDPGRGPISIGTETPPAAPAAKAASSGDSKLDKLIDEGRYDNALALYRVATRKNPGDPKAQAGVELCEGLKALAEGDRLEAAQRLEAVLELDPENERALRAVADIKRRATEERKGFLTRLLRKE